MKEVNIEWLFLLLKTKGVVGRKEKEGEVKIVYIV